MEANPIIHEAPDAPQNTLEELLRYEKKNLLINRIKLVCAALCVVICIVVAIILTVNVGKITKEVESVSAVLTETGENIDVVAKDLNKIDFEALGTSIQSFAEVGTETIEQIKTSTQGLDEIMEQVKIAVGNLSDVNIEELNNGIKTLSDVLTPLAKFFNAFR